MHFTRQYCRRPWLIVQPYWRDLCCINSRHIQGERIHTSCWELLVWNRWYQVCWGRPIWGWQLPQGSQTSRANMSKLTNFEACIEWNISLNMVVIPKSPVWGLKTAAYMLHESPGGRGGFLEPSSQCANESVHDQWLILCWVHHFKHVTRKSILNRLDRDSTLPTCAEYSCKNWSF